MPLDLAAAGVSYTALTIGIGLGPGGAIIIGGTIVVCAGGPEQLRILADYIER